MLRRAPSFMGTNLFAYRACEGRELLFVFCHAKGKCDRYDVFGWSESLKRNAVSRRTSTRTNKLSSISQIVGSQEQF